MFQYLYAVSNVVIRVCNYGFLLVNVSAHANIISQRYDGISAVFISIFFIVFLQLNCTLQPGKIIGDFAQHIQVTLVPDCVELCQEQFVISGTVLGWPQTTTLG